MTIDISRYTSFEEVRASLGVSDEEVDNELISLEMYSIGLSEDLHDVSPDLLRKYAEIEAKEGEERTAQEARVYSLTRLFATYSVSKQVGGALPMLSPRTISDGKASMSRFSGEPYKEVLKRVSEQYELYRGRLVRAVEDLTAQTAPVVQRTALLGVIPTYDPVTGA